MSVISPYASFPGGLDVSGPHAYWRILITLNNGDVTHSGITKLEMYEGYARVNKCFGGTALEGGHVFANVAANAFNQDYTTAWINVNGANAWLGYQFAAPVIINGVMLRARDQEEDQLPQNFDVQCSDDGVTWATKWSVSGQTTWLYREGRWFWDPAYVSGLAPYSGSPSQAFRYLRVHCLDNEAPTGASGGVSCAELQLKEIPGGADITDGAPGNAIAMNASGSFPVTQAFDGNVSTRWAATTSLDLNWIGWDFGVGVTHKVAQFTWTSANNNAATAIQSMRRGVVQGSDDNFTTWSSFFDGYNPAAMGLGELRTYTDPLYV